MITRKRTRNIRLCRGHSALAAVLFSIACTPTSTLPPELDFPAAYRIQSSGSVDLDGTLLPGGAQMDYLVYPSGRVVVSKFDAWISDLDIVVNFLWWETNRERLRCNRIVARDPIVGSLSGTNVDFRPSSASFLGYSHDMRDSAGNCPGLAREVDATNDGPFRFLHEPNRDRFQFRAGFTAVYDGNRVPLRLELDGNFLNRPPTAVIATGAPGVRWQDMRPGCPVGPQGLASIPANSPDGLVLNLRSMSSDIDDRESARFNSEFSRADISTEQWGHSTGGKYAFLSEGRLIGPVLFRTGLSHALLLTVTDRTGAKARDLCRFEVVAAP